MRRLFYSLTFLYAFLSFHTTSLGQTFTLVRDINLGDEYTNDRPEHLTEFGGSLYFTVGTTNPVLWKTDGTANGTIRLKEFTGMIGIQLVKNNNTLFIAGGNTIAAEYQLWKTDGTEAGTTYFFGWGLSNFATGPVVSSNGIMYLHLGVTHELWRSDGTAPGTTLLNTFTAVSNMTDVSGTLFFYGDGALWKSNGTAAGTVVLKTVTVTATVAVNGILLFKGNDNVTGDELWKSDGTPAGTVLVKDIVPGSGGSNISNFAIANNILYFFANTSAHTHSLWRSDGTVAGTTMVTALLENPSSERGPNSLTSANNILFFQGYDDTHGNALWKSDGTAGGTGFLKDLQPVVLYNANGTLYFSTPTDIGVWKSDGTEAGTVLVKSGYKQPLFGKSISEFGLANGIIFFSAYEENYGFELWKTDGTTNGTAVVKNLIPSPSSNPQQFVAANGTVYFSAFDYRFLPTPQLGRTIYQTDGSNPGTVPAESINNQGHSTGLEFASHNGNLFISSPTSTEGNELFIITGNGVPPVKLKDINPLLPNSSFRRGSFPEKFKSAGQFLYFSADDGTNGRELWRTDGTEAGTVLVKNINAGGDSNFDNPVNVNGILYFTADNGTDGIELWKSDGTEAGTLLVKNINASGNSNPANLTAVNNVLYFTADDGANGIELWKSDGTEAGTALVKNINAATGSNPNALTNINGVLYFSANDGTNGQEAWKTDGTNAGTILLKDIYPGAAGSNPSLFTFFNGTVLFAADNGVVGRELWGTDGTAVGTLLLKDILPGAAGSNPTALTKIGNNILFAANDGVHGNEVWQSNGTGTGTMLMGEIQLGAAGSDPTEFFELGTKVLVAATNELFGSEVWISAIQVGNPLPLTILEFKGAVVNSDGLLNWKTENENNTSSFIIERSLNGRDYSSVGTVAAANSPNVHYYDFTDVNIAALGVTNIYYRLKQTDIDGKYTYSHIVVLSIGNKKSIVLLYPNPAKDKLNLTFTLPEHEKLHWQLTDNTGRTIKTGMYNLTAGSTTASIDVANLGAGIYILQLKGTTVQKVIKVVKE